MLNWCPNLVLLDLVIVTSTVIVYLYFYIFCIELQYLLAVGWQIIGQ